MLNIWPILWRGLKIDLTNFGRVVNFLLNPMLVLIFFGVAFSVHVQRVPYMGQMVRFTDFFVPGLLVFQVFVLFSLTFSKVRMDKTSNVISTIALSKTSLSSYYYGLLLASVVETLIRIAFLTILASVIVGSPVPLKFGNLILIILSVSVGSCIWFSLGFICGLLIVREDVRDFIFSLVVLPTSFASSLYYNVDYAPPLIKTLAALNPLTYNCDVIREAFLLTMPLMWRSYLFYLLILAIFLLLLSTNLVKRSAG